MSEFLDQSFKPLITALRANLDEGQSVRLSRAGNAFQHGERFSQVEVIRECVKSGAITYAQLSDDLNIDPGDVSRAIKNPTTPRHSLLIQQILLHPEVARNQTDVALLDVVDHGMCYGISWTREYVIHDRKEIVPTEKLELWYLQLAHRENVNDPRSAKNLWDSLPLPARQMPGFKFPKFELLLKRLQESYLIFIDELCNQGML